MADVTGPDGGTPATHVVGETGLAVRLEGAGDGPELAGTVQVVPELHVPGTQVLRTSLFATWADVLTGLLAMASSPDRVPVTLDLAVDVVEPVRGGPVLEGRARTVKAGRAVVVLEVEFRVQGSGEPVAVGSAAFVPSPDPAFRLPPLAETVAQMQRTPVPPLRLPLAERAGCTREGAGTAVLLRRADGLNATGTVNGALLALVAEEAVLSAAEPGAVLTALSLRYLRAARTGPVVAAAQRRGSFWQVELRDEGAGGRAVARALARTG